MGQPIYRPFRHDDLPGFVALVRANGFPSRSVAGWQWAIYGAPDQADHPVGFVTERDGEIIAFVGMQIRRVTRGDELKLLAGGHNLITLPSGRGYGLRVLKCLLNYADADAVITTNNNALSSRLFPHVGGEAILGEEGRSWCDWTLRPVMRTVGRGMNLLARSDRVYRLFQKREWFGARLKRDWNVPTDRKDIRRMNPADPGDQKLIRLFEQAYRAQYPHRFLPSRSPENYQWRLSDPDFPNRSLMLGAFEGEKLVALAMVTMTKPNYHEPWMAYVTDYVSLPEAEASGLSGRLMKALAEAARHRGAALMRMQPYKSMPKSVRRDSGAHTIKPISYDYTFVKYSDTGDDLRAAFVPGPYDGDMFYALRSPLSGT